MGKITTAHKMQHLRASLKQNPPFSLGINSHQRSTCRHTQINFYSGPAFLQQVKELIETRYGNSFLFKRGYQIKKEFLAESRLVNDSMYDMFVFRDIRQTLFGGNLRLLYINNGKHSIDLSFFLLLTCYL
jgi:hypothetical protein